MPGAQASHSLIVGVSGSGKSTWSHRMAAAAFAARRLVLVYEPMGYTWPCDLATGDFAKLLAVAKLNRDADVFIEEAHTVFSSLAEHQPNAWLLRQGRHQGHSVRLITQRYRDIPPNSREQCSEIYCFRQGYQSIRALVEERAEPLFERAATLEVGQFIHKKGLQPATIRRG
jgi:DNA helicase HerA-like ATPase